MINNPILWIISGSIGLLFLVIGTAYLLYLYKKTNNDTHGQTKKK